VELAGEIRAKRIGCRELLEHYFRRVERYNPALNAIIVTDLQRARQRADAADAALARGESWGPLHGVPMTVKESFDVAGLPTCWGAPEFAKSIASRNALLVERMLAAGVVLFGKTNVPLFLSDFQSYNAVYGATVNPWDPARTPGGSSGGSAAALAAGLTALEAGSDIGSSLRNPAHYCGVYAHKPTYAVVSPRGHALAGRVATTDISVVGPMARSAADLETALPAMAGPDGIDGRAWRIELPPARQERLADNQRLTARFRTGCSASPTLSPRPAPR
jgi:amidase